jgi:tRNA synthetases class I (W and Y)
MCVCNRLVRDIFILYGKKIVYGGGMLKKHPAKLLLSQKENCRSANPVDSSAFTMRILSGIQSSGRLHIGNYFGMMQPAIALQAEGETFYFIANYHALTTVQDPAVMRENSWRVAVDLLACGLDPEKGALFFQSDIPQVTELAWRRLTLIRIRSPGVCRHRSASSVIPFSWRLTF